MNDKKSVSYLIANELTDKQCVSCKRSCVQNSLCSSRYHSIHGDYDGDNDLLSSIAMCDKCFNKYQPESGQYVTVNGRRFYIDNVYREND